VSADNLRDRFRMPASEIEAVALQSELAGCVVVADPPGPVDVVAGLDIAYDTDSDHVVASAVAMRREDHAVVDQAVVRGRAEFPYIPGLLAFRELPMLLDAVQALTADVDLYLCDGYGLTHPRRFGLACHLGVLLDAPAVGVAKNPPHLPVDDPGPRRGDRTAIRAGVETVGCVLRTRDDVKPVYVSVGHRCTLDAACDLVLDFAPRYRIPEPVRAADRLGRERLAAGQSSLWTLRK
jgi:deoxyribonuclease V